MKEKHPDLFNLFIFLGIIIVVAAGIAAAVFAVGRDKQKNITAIIETSKGTIKLELYKNDAPNTVNNFVQLAKKGYYNNLVFHRVIADFIVQAGDPKGDGTGGESATGKPFADELNPDTDSYKAGYVKGILAMANSGPNTNGSQFFITVDDVNKDPNKPDKKFGLQKNYTIFGKVTSGQEIADEISKVKTNPEDDKPVEPITIKSVQIVE